MPRFEHATVADVMRHGVIMCSPETSLRDVARMMCSYHVHAVVLAEDDGAGEPSTWAVISDHDVLMAAHEGAEELNASQVSQTPAVLVAPGDPLNRAAQLMREHRTTHVIVVAADGSRPVGVVSTLDIAGALAWGEA